MTLIEKLSSFDPLERRAALKETLSGAPPFTKTGRNVNMHIHSFFSFNADGHSPTRIAWDARRGGLYAAALCDFDVLDGMEEFIGAGEMLGLRTAVHLETRAFFPELRDVDISSPGEPGVTYIMGAGFVRTFPKESPQEAMLSSFRLQAERRNRALLERINRRIPALPLDYEADVLPLTPAGCATERHIVRAYTIRAEALFPEPVAFWSDQLGIDAAEAERNLSDRPSLEDAVRARLVKRGGLAYAAPTTDTFPPIDGFIRWVLACGAVPMATWLDGTSAGEEDPERLLDLLVAKGAAAVNIIPDRNWRIADPEEARKKQDNLRCFVGAAVRRRLPVNIGTEMNKRGLPAVDDLQGAVLREYRDPFLRGARIMAGHGLLSRYGGFSYVGEAADGEFTGDPAGKNLFFEAVGSLPPLDAAGAEKLRSTGTRRGFASLADSGRAGAWRL